MHRPRWSATFSQAAVRSARKVAKALAQRFQTDVSAFL
ncbi:MAG: hypothetical protein CPSOU_0400 [uncultured Paraburkholderia sp.]|nr:MAG: hypothetical protein CPSOU_0400 [uncultured Paraburkholderia sp.]